MLQARPITTHVPLPPELITEPGEQRLLYADTGMAKGATINAPISPMGLDRLKTFMAGVSKWIFGFGSTGARPGRETDSLCRRPGVSEPLRAGDAGESRALGKGIRRE